MRWGDGALRFAVRASPRLLLVATHDRLHFYDPAGERETWSHASHAHPLPHPSPGKCARPPPRTASLYMVISVALAREQARLVIKGAESCEKRWGNQPGNLPVGVAPVGLVGVVAGASVDSMGLLPQQ